MEDGGGGGERERMEGGYPRGVPALRKDGGRQVGRERGNEGGLGGYTGRERQTNTNDL